MDEVWRRLTQGRSTQKRDLASGDREGARLYLEFDDCLNQHKHHVFYGAAAVTIPWAYYKKSIGPFVIGMILALLPDLLYANWRCDEQFRTFQRHCDLVQHAMQQRQQQQEAQQAQQAAQQAQQAAQQAAHPRASWRSWGR